MVELLVVIAVLGLLIGLIAVVASKVIRQQKVRNTQQLMQNVMLAIDEFASENPLRQIYDRKDQATFGKYPPYQLANFEQGNSVPQAVEPGNPGGNNRLSDRLWRDLGRGEGALSDWAWLGGSDQGNEGDGHDDIRALAAYLTVYAPDSLMRVPESARKPIDASARDYVNPRGTGGTPGTQDAPGWVDVLPPHDAWGVPLDYMLYVKCEWRLRPPGNELEWVVTERRPVLRSRGVEREVYEAWLDTSDEQAKDRLSPPGKWIFSEELPRPWADVNESGIFEYDDDEAAGWARAVALEDDYGYRPDQDTEEP